MSLFRLHRWYVVAAGITLAHAVVSLVAHRGYAVTAIGDVFDAQRCLEVGLVGSVVPHDELIPAAVALATRVAAKPWRALESTKAALRASWQQDLASSMTASFWAVSALYHQDDLLEAINAFLEKRSPEFNKDV